MTKVATWLSLFPTSIAHSSVCKSQSQIFSSYMAACAAALALHSVEAFINTLLKLSSCIFFVNTGVSTESQATV